MSCPALVLQFIKLFGSGFMHPLYSQITGKLSFQLLVYHHKSNETYSQTIATSFTPINVSGFLMLAFKIHSQYFFKWQYTV